MSFRVCEEINWTNYSAGFLPEFKARPQVHSKIKLFTKDATQKSGKKTSENVQVISLQTLMITPKEYDAWYKTPLGSLCGRLEKEAVFGLFKPDGLVLDIGCGTGNYTLELLRRNVRAIGIDSAFDMVMFAKNKITANGFKPLLVVGSAEQLPFKDNSFNSVLEVTALCFIEHTEAVIKESFRVLKPKGTITIGELNRFSYWAFLRRLKGLLKKSIYRQARFFTIKELSRLLETAGFKDLKWSSCIYFPPINAEWFLKGYRFFENIGKLFPQKGAFVVVSGRR